MLGDRIQSGAQAILAAAPMTGPAAPFVAAAAELIAVGDSIFHAFSNYDPRKEHDTAAVEAFMAAFHTIWYTITGEALPGIPGVSATTQPGNYGNAGINLFGPSAYPNVPYPAGAPGVNLTAAMNSLASTYQAAAQSMQRPESIPNLQQNFNYAATLLQSVATNQQQHASLFDLSNTSGGLPAGLPSWIVPAAIAVGLVMVIK